MAGKKNMYEIKCRESRPDRPTGQTEFWQDYWQKRLETNCALTQSIARSELDRLDQTHGCPDNSNPDEPVEEQV